MGTVAEAKELIPELCRQFYTNGWVSGTGGGMSIRVGDKHVVAPSGVQKERMAASDLFVLDPQGNVLEQPETRPPPYKAPKLSECYPLFQQAFNLRDAGAVMHSHSVNAVLATLLDEGSEFRVTNLEMIKGIQGHGYYDTLCIPIIENTARECELTASLREAIIKYPKTSAVLVRRHGVYVWGKDWIQAKTQAECYDYLFEAAVRMRAQGIDASVPPTGAPASKKRKLEEATPSRQAVVLDIEGTLTPLSFVQKTLFPYAAKHMDAFLKANVDSPAVHACLQSLHDQARKEGEPDWGEAGIANQKSYKKALSSAMKYIRSLMDADRKLGPLKQLQGMIWHKGYLEGELTADLFPDVLSALQQWAAAGVKVYIFSSGSRQAQSDLFAHTAEGDVRHLLAGFFDTSSGAKVEATAYKEIALAIGMEPEQITFATDIAREADAAQAAGWQATLVSRPGNAELAKPVQHAVIQSLAQLQLPAQLPHKAAKLMQNGTSQNGHH